MAALEYAEVEAARVRVAAHVRPLTVTAAESRDARDGGSWELLLALEFLQHTGTFKARGAQNFVRSHVEAGTLPEAGVTIASGGNAGMACAWAAREQGVRATVFVPTTAPAVKVQRLREYGAEVREVGAEYAEAQAACVEFAARTGALQSHAYDLPLIAAGAGTLMSELCERVPNLDTVVVSVGGGGLFAGVAAVAAERGIRVVAVEPEHCRALNAALEAGHPVDVTPDSVAADSLGARRISELALRTARAGDVVSVLVTDEEIVRARRRLWDEHRLAVEHAAAAALAGVVGAGGYHPVAGERVAVVLCGANTDPADLVG